MSAVTLTSTDTIERIEAETATGRVFVVSRRVLTDAQGDVVARTEEHRRPIEPTADVEAEDPDVKAIAKRIRTAERTARYEALTAEPVTR